LGLGLHPGSIVIQALCDGELSPPDRRLVLVHLAGCRTCRTDADARERLAQPLTTDALEPNALELSELKERLFCAIDSDSTRKREEDVRFLLGRSSASELGRPGTPVTPDLDRHLSAFLGVRATAELKTAWTQG
jgi:hypothetical protein